MGISLGFIIRKSPLSILNKTKKENEKVRDSKHGSPGERPHMLTTGVATYKLEKQFPSTMSQASNRLNEVYFTLKAEAQTAFRRCKELQNLEPQMTYTHPVVEVLIPGPILFGLSQC